MSAAVPLPLLQEALARVSDVVLITEAEPKARPGPRIVFVNAAFERMTGYTAAEVLGETPRILQGPRTDARVLQALSGALARWEPMRVQVTNYRKNGVPFDVEFDVTPIPDERGWYTHWVSFQRDVTYSSVGGAVILQAHTLDELATGLCTELREYLGADGVAWCMRTAGQPWHVLSDGGLEITDVGAVEAGDHVLRVPLTTAGELEVHLVASSATHPFDAYQRGLLAAVAARATPAADRLYAVLQRERMAAALRQSEKLEAIGRLAGGVAHDFNNLLTVMMGNAEFLQALTPSTPETAPLFGDFQRAALRARELVQHLLVFARKRRIEQEPVALDGAIEGAVALLERSTADVLHITTAVETPPPVAIGDTGMLEQVLVNLVLNARDAIAGTSRQSPGEVRIVAARASVLAPTPGASGNVLPAGRYVAIDVIDDGPGMPEEVRRRAFDPFFTTKPTGAGVGLGLSSAYGAVTAMGGTIELADVVPHGTRARILLPAA